MFLFNSMGKQANTETTNIDNVSAILVSMAEALGVDYKSDQNVHCLEIPKKMGSGFIRATHFDNGLDVIEIDYQLKKKLIIEIKRGILHPLKFLFNRDSKIKHHFTEEKESHTIRCLNSVITASTPKLNHVFTIPANKTICMFIIEVNRKLFEDKIGAFVPEMNEELIDIFRDLNGVNKFYYQGYYSLDIAKLLEEYAGCELDSFMKYVFLEGKANEIVVHQLKQYLDDLHQPEKRKILRQSTIKSIQEAVQIIEQEIDTIGSIKTLATRVGLNQNTLQSGFKYLFKRSVKEYIKHYRIEKAKELLDTTNLNITEITYKIGINSRSYFSKIFKDAYGVTPNAYRTSVTKNKSA